MKLAPIPVAWQSAQGVPPKQYRCGFCEQSVASNIGLITSQHDSYSLRICPLCQRPTYFETGTQYPGITFGSPVGELPADVETLYNEARLCYSVASYNGAVLLLRKLLMNIAVNTTKAPEGATFIKYIEHLAAAGYVPPHGKGWVDHIRKKGNEANHEITLMNKADAEELIVFSEMLLKFIYEFPKRVPQAPTP